MMATLIHEDGRAEQVLPANRVFSLKELQDFVGGYIEMVKCLHGGQVRYMVVNEEGKIKGLPRNDKATDMFQAGWRSWEDHIVGKALVCEPGEIE